MLMKFLNQTASSEIRGCHNLIMRIKMVKGLQIFKYSKIIVYEFGDLSEPKRGKNFELHDCKEQPCLNGKEREDDFERKRKIRTYYWGF